MKQGPRHLQRLPLFAQLWRFVQLRWLAGGGVVLGGLVEQNWLHHFGHAFSMLALGLTILLYNLLLRLALPRLDGKNRHPLVILSWLQIVLDLGCLTLLTLWTGGLGSPLLGFYVFHMVFASLLLPRGSAFAASGVAMAMFIGGTWLSGEFPQSLDDRLLLAGWMMTLLLTVGLVNRISFNLRRQRRRLLRQNRHIRMMSRRLRQQQQAIIRSEKMAALGQMAAGVAHEIANPLASMDGLLQLAQRRPDKRSADTIATLRQQVARINEIVRQMTAFAHPAEGQWQTVPLSEVVEQALRMVQFDRRLQRVSIERQYGTESHVRLLPQAIQQVLVNLVFNAVDAMAEVAQPRLIIRTAQAGQWLEVEVTDNGQGISPQHMERLFEPFFTTKPVGKGTGLGLSISYSLVRKHGGEIDVRSLPGEGASFIVRLPGPEASRNRETNESGVALSENRPL